MKRLLFLLSILLFNSHGFSQLPPVQLQVKKNGKIKKRVAVGDEVFIRTNKNEIFNGNIFYLRKDSVYFRYATIAANSIVELKLKKRRRLHFDLAEFGWVTLGVGLTTAGLVAADWYKFPKAFQTATSIGYTPYLLRLLGLLSFKKFHYKIGKRYQLLVWDIR